MNTSRAPETYSHPPDNSHERGYAGRARRSDRVRMHAFALSLVRAVAIQQASSSVHTADLVSWSRGR